MASRIGARVRHRGTARVGQVYRDDRGGGSLAVRLEGPDGPAIEAVEDSGEWLIQDPTSGWVPLDPAPRGGT